MSYFPRPFLLVALFVTFLVLPRSAPAKPPEEQAEDAIPGVLKPWEDWATWNDQTRGVPTPFNDPKKSLPFWPSRLEMQADRAGGRFGLDVWVFRETWVPLPGGADVWPSEVKADSHALPVVEHGGVPAVRLGAGTHRLEGVFRWGELPRGLTVSREIGLLALTVDGKPVEAPTWDAGGFLWLRRDGAAEPVDKDFLATKVYAVLEDGIPLWLRTEIELTVAGKSREEDLGAVLPEGRRPAVGHADPDRPPARHGRGGSHRYPNGRPAAGPVARVVARRGHGGRQTGGCPPGARTVTCGSSSRRAFTGSASRGCCRKRPSGNGRINSGRGTSASRRRGGRLTASAPTARPRRRYFSRARKRPPPAPRRPTTATISRRCSPLTGNWNSAWSGRCGRRSAGPRPSRGRPSPSAARRTISRSAAASAVPSSRCPCARARARTSPSTCRRTRRSPPCCTTASRSPCGWTTPGSWSRCVPASNPWSWIGRSTPRSGSAHRSRKSGCRSPARTSRPPSRCPTTAGPSGRSVPQLGPAVRFWGILACSLLAAVTLGRLGRSPLGTGAWMLLVLGLTQVFLPAALCVVAWLFLLEWRGGPTFAGLLPWRHNLFQALLLGLTFVALVTLVAAVAEGLLGNPEMFILGNGSSRTVLRWFQARGDGPLPRPGAFTVSVWWYRLLMLAWALWLAASLLRWLRRGWDNFSRGGVFRRPVPVVRRPPPLPVTPP